MRGRLQSRQNRGVWGKFKIIIISIFVLGFLWFGFTQWIILTSDSMEDPPKSDVGIVLGAVLWDDKPSPALAERLDHALRLFQAGRFDRFIVSGGLDSSRHKLTEAQGMANYLMERGVPKDRIILENKATSTYENLVYSKEIMAEHHFKQAIIITHKYHGARSLEIAKFIGYEHPFLSTTDSKVLNLAWHQTREALAYTKWKLDQMFFGFREHG